MLEGIGLLLHIGVMLVFLIIVLNSKHLHIFVAPLNVLFGRQPGRARRGQAADVERQAGHPRRHRGPGRGRHARRRRRSRTSPGRACSTSRPAPSAAAASRSARRGTPRSRSRPKLLIMDLRDHAFAEGAVHPGRRGRPRRRCPRPCSTRPERPLVGATEGGLYPTGGAVIDPDVLWSCTTCGACVNQCPVDIEHVDHIVDMRRYQVLVESNFPAELNQLFKGLENKGNPWNMSANGADGLGQGPRLRGQGRRRGRRVARRGRVAVLGRLRRRLRGPREEDHPRGRRAARHGRRLLRRARQRRDLHRRPGPPRRQRVRLPGPGAAERRDASRRPRSRRSSPPARTASTR